MPHTDRAASYAALVRARKSCRACTRLINPADCDGGVYDSDHIGPWSQWQGNLNADLLIVGQDWGDTRYFTDNQGREKAQNTTNEVLQSLLWSIGIEIPAPGAGDVGGGPCFFSNAVLCLKQGGMQAKVDSDWFANCAARFLRPTIDLVEPKVVVTLGKWAYMAVRAAYVLPRVAFRKAVERSEGFQLAAGVTYVPVYHCGRRILNTHRPIEQQLRDWQRVRRALHDTA